MSGNQKRISDVKNNSSSTRESRLFQKMKDERENSSSDSRERSNSLEKFHKFKKIITFKDVLKKHYRYIQKEAENLDLALDYNKNDNTIEICGKQEDVEIFNYFIRTFGRIMTQLQKENIENRPPQPKYVPEPKPQQVPKKEKQKKTFDLNNITDFTDDIIVQVLELGLEPRLLNNGHISIEGEENKVNRVDDYIKGIVLAKKSYEKKFNEEKPSKQKSKEVYSEKQLELHQLVLSKKQEIDQKIEELSLIQEKVNRHFSFVGPCEKLLDFVTWLYETTLDSVKQKLPKHNFDELEDLVMITHFPSPETLAFNRKNIRSKAEELGLIIKFEPNQLQGEGGLFRRPDQQPQLIASRLMISENKLQVEGSLAGILEFKKYLADNEKVMKKSLYPKYWDFEEDEVLIEIDDATEEFNKVAGEFNKTMKKHVITRLVRIQSKELLNMYLTAMKGFNGNNGGDLEKKLLFQGTVGRKPLEFYNIRNPKELNYQRINYEENNLSLGRKFDPFSQPKIGLLNQSYIVNQAFNFKYRASDAHKNAYRVNNNLFQMLWVEICIDGHHSHEDDGYKPYNQNCVYPCYLIEYTGAEIA